MIKKEADEFLAMFSVLCFNHDATGDFVIQVLDKDGVNMGRANIHDYFFDNDSGALYLTIKEIEE